MKITTQIAHHLRVLYFGGNWTDANFQQHLKEVSWQQALTKVYGFNTIATLVYHATYYASAVSKVLQGLPLDAKDALSFAHPTIASQEDWQAFLQNVWNEIETFAQLIETLPDDKLEEVFWDKKYGTYYRNLQGIIEHAHYHLGQLVLIKKIVLAQTAGLEKTPN